ncbi:hypothetical protein SDC9_30426 [bioreactor metagenome]|uniref:Uncharacterized protein n=1 Tax=bioreactor metagenome TaxID=1076179 RepID=A0A644UZU9_9ZZZZ
MPKYSRRRHSPPPARAPVSELLDDHRADGITRPEGADQPGLARREIAREAVEGDDRAGRGGVGVVLQDIRLLARFRLAAKHLAADEIVHRLVRLMQPEPAQGGGREPFLRQMAEDMGTDHRQHFLEDLAALLHELHVAPVGEPVGPGAAQEAVVVADVVRELGGAAARADLEAAGLRLVAPLDQRRGRDIAEDEVAVAVTPFEMARGDLGVHHQRTPHRAGADHVGRGLDAEGGRGAGDVHVEGKARGAQKLLDLDRDGGIGTLHVRGGADHQIDLAPLAPGGGQGRGAGLERDLGHDPGFVVAALTQLRIHPRGIENAALVHHMAALDTRGLVDELGRGMVLRHQRARRDLGRVLGVVTVGIGVEGGDQLVVGDGLRRGEDPGSGDRRGEHLVLSKVAAQSFEPRRGSRVRPRSAAPCRHGRRSGWQVP